MPPRIWIRHWSDPGQPYGLRPAGVAYFPQISANLCVVLLAGLLGDFSEKFHALVIFLYMS